MQIFQIQLKYFCSQRIKLQKFLRQYFEGVSPWRVKSFGIDRIKSIKSLLGVKGLSLQSQASQSREILEKFVCWLGEGGIQTFFLTCRTIFSLFCKMRLSNLAIFLSFSALSCSFVRFSLPGQIHGQIMYSFLASLLSLPCALLFLSFH